MESESYESSLFWYLLTEGSQFLNIFGIPILIIAICTFAYKKQSKLRYIAFVGATLVLGGHITRIFVPEVFSVALSGFQPAKDQNVLIHFLYLHGASYGFAILGTSLIFLFKNEKNL